MERREALKKSAIAALGIGALPNLMVLLQSCSPERLTNYQPAYLSTDQYDTIWQIAELVLPRTTSPGANDAAVAPYIDLLFAEFFDDEGKEWYSSGLKEFMTNCEERHGKTFIALSETEQLTLLEELDNDEDEESFFRALKGTILWGYFTSEQGMKSMNYSPVPGKYEGCIQIDEQEKNLVGNR